MTLTHRQLAENGTVAAVTWLECAFCGFLSRDLELVKPAVPCPQCEDVGRSRRIFPDMSSDRLLEMISHFYARAWERVDDTKAALADTLRLKLRREYPQAKVVEAALRVRECLCHSDGSQEGFERLLDEIHVCLPREVYGFSQSGQLEQARLKHAADCPWCATMLNAAPAVKSTFQQLLPGAINR